MSFYQRTRNLTIISDSIGDRGYALGNHADLISPQHPIYGFSSPWRMMNLVFAENNMNIRANSYSIGSMAQANLATELAAYAVSSSVGDQDMFVFSDAGLHPATPNAYQTAYGDVLSAVKTARPSLQLRAMTVMDNSPAAGLDYQWDVSFIGQGTMNQAIIAAALAQDVTLIDANTDITAYWALMLANHGMTLPLSDNIHLAVWDQMKWDGLILNSFGLTPAILNRTSLTSIAADNFAALAYGSGTWTQQNAVDECAVILG